MGYSDMIGSIFNQPPISPHDNQHNLHNNQTGWENIHLESIALQLKQQSTRNHPGESVDRVRIMICTMF